VPFSGAGRITLTDTDVPQGVTPTNWGRRITGITGELRHQAMDEKQPSLCLVPSETRMST
jgi:hypothetical protein